MGTKINVIVTGASGMVGEGVMHECLNHPDVEKVLVIGRKPCGTNHPKLTEIIHKDFFNLTPIADQLKGYTACYFCLGVSSVGMKEPEYKKLTYDLTMHASDLLAKLNPEMTFCYVSGAATDSTEKGRVMWARVKGKTENDVMKLPFKAAYVFRPGYMQPTPGLNNTLKYYKYFSWMYPFLKTVFPGSVSTLADLGQAMLGVTLKGYDKKVLEVRDIKAVAKR
ncbi:MAG: epimerase [Imperialibacter sp.]|uniref:NAD-dependent epimerase/dehydratase family protein n=1 Tax=Imperialibacter sp. TaxID=2038411 RepID=UPI0032F0657E